MDLNQRPEKLNQFHPLFSSQELWGLFVWFLGGSLSVLTSWMNFWDGNESRRDTQITPFSLPSLHICTDLHPRTSALIKPELVPFFQSERSSQGFSPPDLVSTKDQVPTALMDNAEQPEKKEHIYNQPNVAKKSWADLSLWTS